MPHKVFFILLLAFALCACKDRAAKPASNAPIEKYQLEGEVLTLDPQGHIAKIKHREIKGWMEAMTMEYSIKDPAEFDKLRAGDRITATVFVQGLNYWLGDIHQVR